MPVDTTTCGFMALDAKSGKPIELAMQQLWLQGRILPPQSADKRGAFGILDYSTGNLR